MTKFCTDLIYRQLGAGDTVGLIWPGSIHGGKVKIKHRKNISGAESIEIVNPLPVPYDEGILNIQSFIKDEGYICYKNFFEVWRPDVLHLHTLMGLHKSMVRAAKDLHIRVIFTAHDFFPLCTKVSMTNGNGVCKCAETCSGCPVCNSTALSLHKLTFLQSDLYRMIKDRSFVTKIRKKHRHAFLEEKNTSAPKKVLPSSNEYMKLRQHYLSIVMLADVVHYNSSLTENVYSKYITHPNSVVVPVTHGDIRNKKKKKMFGEKLRITYLGPPGKAKGFHRLKSALDLLEKENHNFVLNIFFEPEKAEKYMQIHRRYSYNMLDSIFENTDIMISPTASYDTFGFTVAEALSRGVPVLVTDNTGAKDVIPDGGGIVIKSADHMRIYSALSSLNIKSLESMNSAIIEKADIMDMRAFCKMIKEIYSR